MHEIFLDDVAFVTQADNKIIKPVLAVNFHDMPENRLAADLHHGFWPGISLFRYTGTKPPGE